DARRRDGAQGAAAGRRGRKRVGAARGRAGGLRAPEREAVLRDHEAGGPGVFRLPRLRKGGRWGGSWCQVGVRVVMPARATVTRITLTPTWHQLPLQAPTSLAERVPSFHADALRPLGRE